MARHRASQPRRVQQRARLLLVVLVAVNAVLWAAALSTWARHEHSAGRVMSRSVAQL